MYPTTSLHNLIYIKKYKLFYDKLNKNYNKMNLNQNYNFIHPSIQPNDHNNSFYKIKLSHFQRNQLNKTSKNNYWYYRSLDSDKKYFQGKKIQKKEDKQLPTMNQISKALLLLNKNKQEKITSRQKQKSLKTQSTQNKTKQHLCKSCFVPQNIFDKKKLQTQLYIRYKYNKPWHKSHRDNSLKQDRTTKIVNARTQNKKKYGNLKEIHLDMLKRIKEISKTSIQSIQLKQQNPQIHLNRIILATKPTIQAMRIETQPQQTNIKDNIYQLRTLIRKISKRKNSNIFGFSNVKKQMVYQDSKQQQDG